MRLTLITQAACLCIMQAVFFSACSRPSHSGELTFFDQHGNAIASAHLKLPDPLPPAGEFFSGKWSLQTHERPFPAEATDSGAYAGYVFASGVSCDLNPNVADNNVVLVGAIVGNRFTGTWSIATDAGDEEQGTFQMQIK